MRHLKAHRKLGRTTAHRMSMLRNLATSLINARDERIITTLPKAKELRPFVERAITLSRRAHGLEGDNTAAETVHLRRQAAAFFHSGNRNQSASTGRRGATRAPRTAGVAALKRLFDELGARFHDRPGGYTRIIKLGRRDGDNAELAIIELVDNPRERGASATTDTSTKRAKSAATGKKKTAKASREAEETNARRGGRKADKTYEKKATTRRRGEQAGDDASKDKKTTSSTRRTKKKEPTGGE
jgi:large subunit ribosomal protein L17